MPLCNCACAAATCPGLDNLSRRSSQSADDSCLATSTVLLCCETALLVSSPFLQCFLSCALAELPTYTIEVPFGAWPVDTEANDYNAAEDNFDSCLPHRPAVDTS